MKKSLGETNCVVSFPSYQLCDLVSFYMEMFSVGYFEVCMCVKYVCPCMYIHICVCVREKERGDMNEWMNGCETHVFQSGFYLYKSPAHIGHGFNCHRNV